MDKAERMTMSEARLNDLVYMLLKKLYFEQFRSAPRECDIRVCMQLSAPALRTGVQDAILLPDERSGRSHDKMLDVCFGEVFDECLRYLEDHWMKTSFEEATGDPNIKQKMWDWCAQGDNLFEIIKTAPEKDCAVSD